MFLKEIRSRLGEFNYGQNQVIGNVEYRPVQILLNHAKYEGEW